MEITVFVQPWQGNGFKARTTSPPFVEVEAPTREAALEKIRQSLIEETAKGEFVRLHIPPKPETNPLLAIAGSLKDHPDLEEYMETLREIRREGNEDPNW